LFSYMAGHGIVALFIARRVGMRLGVAIDKGRLSHIKRGGCLLPPGFIEGACREMGRTVEEVMGAEWMRRYGADVLVGGAVDAGTVVESGDVVDGNTGVRSDVA
jgi:predicted ribosome-associated RNA-binding protein Tma20